MLAEVGWRSAWASPAPGSPNVLANRCAHRAAASSTGELRLWPGRVTYRLRRVEGRWWPAGKTIELLQATGALPNPTFLL